MIGMRVVKSYNIATGQECFPLNANQLRRTDVIAIGERVGARVPARHNAPNQLSASLVELAHQDSTAFMRISRFAMLPQLSVECGWYLQCHMQSSFALFGLVPEIFT
jgi:hypothetical protein